LIDRCNTGHIAIRYTTIDNGTFDICAQIFHQA